MRLHALLLTCFAFQIRLATRKKLVVELWKKGGFLSSAKSLGKAKFPLVRHRAQGVSICVGHHDVTCILTGSTIVQATRGARSRCGCPKQHPGNGWGGATFQQRPRQGVSTTRTRVVFRAVLPSCSVLCGRSCFHQIVFDLRTPLQTPLVKLVVRKELVIDGFPTAASGATTPSRRPVSMPAAAAARRSVPGARRVAKAGGGPGAGAGAGAVGAARRPAASAAPTARRSAPAPPTDIPAKFVKNPFDIDLLVSYDVIVDEVRLSRLGLPPVKVVVVVVVVVVVLGDAMKQL